MALYFDNFETPLGKMEITADNRAVKSILFVEEGLARHPNEVTEATKQQLQEYFAAQRQEFDLPLEPEGTEFQKQVWQALTTIEFGKTCSYADIAQTIKNPKAVRAVGSANGKNPMTIVVPCHRIIGADGSLTGYASGVERKAWLLNHEAPGLF